MRPHLNGTPIYLMKRFSEILNVPVKYLKRPSKNDGGFYDGNTIYIRFGYNSHNLRHEVGHAIVDSDVCFDEFEGCRRCSWTAEVLAEALAEMILGETLDDSITLAKFYKWEFRKFYNYTDRVNWRTVKKCLKKYSQTEQFKQLRKAMRYDTLPYLDEKE